MRMMEAAEEVPNDQETAASKQEDAGAAEAEPAAAASRPASQKAEEDTVPSEAAAAQSADQDDKQAAVQADTAAEAANSTASGSKPSSPNQSLSGRRSTASSGRRRKKDEEDLDVHKVSFTVTIAMAVPTVEDEDQGDVKEASKKKRRIVEAPRAQNYYHCEYQLLPHDDEPVRTDVVTFGMAAKIYTERQEPKVLKTWKDGNLTWIAWTHCHRVQLTEDILLKLFKHKLDMRVWDTKEKVSTRARFDRPKAFRLPQAKPGEDPENIGGVKSMVLKQSRSYEKMQPKRSYINRPLPSKTKITQKIPSTPAPQPPDTQKDQSKGGSRAEKTIKQRKMKAMEIEVPAKLSDYMDSAGHAPGKEVLPASAQLPNPSTSSDSQPIRSYSHLARLAGVDTVEGQDDMNDDGPDQYSSVSKRKATPGGKLSTMSKRSPERSGVPQTAATDSTTLSQGSPTKPGTQGSSAKPRRSKRAEAAAAAAAEQIKKFGICCIPVSMARLFAGVQIITERLEKPVPGVEDLFLTVSLNGPLMSEDQRCKLNPLVIKVHSATQMPATPLPYEDLQQRCQPAYVKYKFYKEPEHISMGREQDESIYWDDVSVVLTGTIEPAELKEYLSGPLLDIEVHDRNRVVEKQKLTATLFGEDLEDEKISNVGTVSGRRTAHNAFSGRDQPWDPYGVARFDLSELLLGQQLLYLKAPVLPCSMPDVLGIRDGKEDGKLVGVSGALDGPVDQPMPAGHYMESCSQLKIKVELAYPLGTTKVKAIASDTEFIQPQCPFGRLVFRFDYKNTEFLQRLQSLLMDINAVALQLSHLPQHIIEAALSTYKLSLEQQRSKRLDIVTGFHLMDGTMHLFVLEGLTDQAINRLWTALPKPEKQDVEVLHNSDFCFKERLYGPLDVDLCRIKLHEPLSVIVQQPLLYVRDMVPKPCFDALVKLDELSRSTKLRDSVRNNLFPNSEMVVSMSREFGVPVTTEDVEELQGQPPVFEIPEEPVTEGPRTSRIWTPIDNLNEKYLKELDEREKQGPPTHFLQENIDDVHKVSELNRIERSRTVPARLRAKVTVPHNYSTQSLNSTELAKQLLRQELAKDQDTRFSYCQDYQHSMTVVPVDVEAVKKMEARDSQKAWKTPQGWTYPGKKTMLEGNVHHKKPDLARVDELKLPWRENTLHFNKLEPTLDRTRYTWSRRKTDMDLWRKPSLLFGAEPITIHLAGQKAKSEQRQAQVAGQSQWQSRLVVDDPMMQFHRCGTQTELTDTGLKSSNQLTRLEGLLKDGPRKFAFRKPGLSLQQVPPLNVVLNPSVDTAARAAGATVIASQLDGEKQKIRGFIPGPFTELSWTVDKNKIPVHDYEHHKFMWSKGHDFNVYHKERSVLHKRPLVPLNSAERDNHLFRLPSDFERTQILTESLNTTRKQAEAPSFIDMKQSRQTTDISFDSGIGTFVKSEPDTKPVIST